MRILVAILPLMFFSLQSYACSCMRYDIEKAYKDYEVVFIGKVTKIGTHKLSDSSFFFPEKIVKAKFEVTKAYKGLKEKEFEVVTQNDSTACGYPFEKGVEYAVFAYLDKDEGKYAVNSCGPTIHTRKKEEYYERERNYVMDFLNSK